MTKLITLGIKVTEKQFELIENTSKSLGFHNKSDYIRSVLFHYLPISEKIDLIYDFIKNVNGKCKEAE